MKHEPITQFNEDAPQPVDLSELGLHLKDNDRTLARLQTPLNDTSTEETSPEYYGTITYMNSKWRLVLCGHGIQWIIQKKRGPSKWENRWFARTKQGLLRGLGRCGDIHEAAWRRIDELPERCEG